MLNTTYRLRRWIDMWYTFTCSVCFVPWHLLKLRMPKEDRAVCSTHHYRFWWEDLLLHHFNLKILGIYIDSLGVVMPPLLPMVFWNPWTRQWRGFLPKANGHSSRQSKNQRLNHQRDMYIIYTVYIYFFLSSTVSIHSHTHNVWYIFLHLAIFMVNVGKYTIHWVSGILK